MDESALIAKAQAGDREALGRLLEAHQGVCYAFALRLTRKPVDAEDVCQDAFLRAARDVAGWRPTGSFRSWLLSLVRHAHGDRADSERARKRREESLAMERKPHVTQSVPTGPAEQAELRRQIELSLERLDDRYRLPISLHYEQGLSYVEAAAALEVPEGTVATNIRRGLEELREMMSRAGYSAATPAAIAAALSQTQAASVPASLTALIKSLAASGGAKVAGATAGSATLCSLAIGWKLAAGATLAVVLSVGFLGLRSHGRAAMTPPPGAPPAPAAPPATPAPAPTVSIEAVLERRVSIDKRHMPFIDLANRLHRETGLKCAMLSRCLRGNVRLEPGEVRVGQLLDSLAKAMGAELEVRELHGGVCAIFWSRPKPELQASLEKLAVSADETERCAAARWLPELGNRQALASAAKLLADKSARVREYAAYGIGGSWQLVSHPDTDLIAVDSPLSLLAPPEAGRAVSEDLNGMAGAPSELDPGRLRSLTQVAAALRLEGAIPGLRTIAKHQLEHPQFYNDGGLMIDTGWDCEALSALCRIGSRDAEAVAAARWRTASPRQRSSMALALASLDTPESRRMLIAALGDEDRGVASSAARSLGLLKASEAEEPILNAMKRLREKPGYAYALPSLVPALLRIDASRHVETAKRAISESPDPWQRAWLCFVLTKEPSAGPWLAPYAEELLGAEKAQVRGQALLVLARVGTEKSVPRIAPLLGSKDASTKRAACEALSAIGGRAAIAELRNALKSDDAKLRADACWALVDLDDEKMVRDLLDAATRDRDPQVREQASRGLQYLDRIVRTAPLAPESAERAMARLGSRLRDLGSPDSATRLAAIRDGSDYGALDPRMMTPLCRLVDSDPDAKVRLAAARTLFSSSAGAMIDPAMADCALRTLKTGKETDIRATAQLALVTLGLATRPDVAAAIKEFRASLPKRGLRPQPQPEPEPIPTSPEVF